MSAVPPQFMDVKIDVSGDKWRRLGTADLARAIERDLLTQAQLNELGLDTPDKVQAALRHDEPAWNPASVEASGNHMTLTPEEVELIRQRREQAEQDIDSGKLPKITPADAVENEDDDDDDDRPYEEWTNDDLRAEIVRRNEGRDEASHLSVSGNKAELVATLEEDDAADDE